jgi:anti-anti-sigma factor
MDMLEAQALKRVQWKMLELDLSSATMIDSMGLNLLVFFLKLATEKGAKMRIRIKDNNLNRLLKFTRLNEHADILYA